MNACVFLVPMYARLLPCVHIPSNDMLESVCMCGCVWANGCAESLSARLSCARVCVIAPQCIPCVSVPIPPLPSSMYVCIYTHVCLFRCPHACVSPWDTSSVATVWIRWTRRCSGDPNMCGRGRWCWWMGERRCIIIILSFSSLFFGCVCVCVCVIIVSWLGESVPSHASCVYTSL